MAIKDRNRLAVDVKLVAKYKGETHHCVVVEDENGKLAFRVGRKTYTSLSAAGKSIIGQECNGWRFWTEAKRAKAA